MVGCDILRAATFAAMTLPGLPLWLVLVLLAVAVFIGPAFTAAEVSMLAQALSAEQFRSATGVRMTTNQIGQVAGFMIGGVIVGALSADTAILVDAVTFAASAGVIGCALGGRAPAARLRQTGREFVPSVFGPIVAMFRAPQIRRLLIVSGLVGFFIVPEGLAVPFADQIGAPTG